MSDNYSVDDILKEYSDKSKIRKAKSEALLEYEAMLRGDDEETAEEIVTDMSFDKIKEDKDPGVELTMKSKEEQEKERKETEEKQKKTRRSISNTALIEGLLKRKKENKEKEAPVTTEVKRAKIADIELDIKNKVLPKTQTISLVEEATEEEKEQILNERRKKRVSEFVLQTEQEDVEPSVEVKQQNADEIHDFVAFEQAPEVLADIIALKGNLVTRLCFLSIAAFLSVYLTFANDLGWPIIDALSRVYQPMVYLFVNVILGLLAAFVCYTVMAAGLSKLMSLKADSDSLAALTVLATLIPASAMLLSTDLLQRNKIHIFIPVAILSLLINTLGKLLIVNRAERNFRYVSGEYEKYAITAVDDADAAERITKGALSEYPVLSTKRKTEFVEDFIKNSYSADMSDAFCKYYVPAILAAGVLVAIISVIFGKNLVETQHFVFTALGGFSLTVSMCAAIGMMLIINLPLSRASKKYLQSSGVILGYSAVDEFADTNSVLVDISDLFPEGTIDLLHLKMMSSTSLEDCILTAASLACQAGSVMSSAFYKMLRGKVEMLLPVESYIYEDGLGLSGWIENKRVLLGTRELMLNHSIDGIPPKTKEDEYVGEGIPLYLSISGVTAALFVVKPSASVYVKEWLQDLVNNKVTVVLRSIDAMLSLSCISELFEIEQDSLKILPFRNHNDYEKQTEYTPRLSSSLLCSGKFSTFAMLLTGTKRIQKTSALGLTIQMTATILGFIICAVYAVLASLGELSCTLAVLYNVIWTLLICSAQSIKRL